MTAFVRLLDARQEAREASGVWSGLPVASIAGVQMHDRRAGFGRADRGLGDLPRAVTGRCGDIEGVWMAPVTAQVMMTFVRRHVRSRLS